MGPPAARHARPLLLGAGLALLVVLAGEGLRVLVGPNFHAIVPHRCYRSGQPTADALEGMVRALGVRTVVNLRGPNDKADWYREEHDAARRLGVTVVDVPL